jgi:uncharacterized membrane protein YbhN (UPF0104 family)
VCFSSSYLGVAFCERANFILNEYNKTHMSDGLSTHEKNAALISELPTNEHMTWRSPFALGLGAVIFCHNYSALNFILSVITPDRRTLMEQAKQIWQACAFYILLAWLFHWQTTPFSLRNWRQTLRSLCCTFAIWAFFNLSLVAVLVSFILPVSIPLSLCILHSLIARVVRQS